VRIKACPFLVFLRGEPHGTGDAVPVGEAMHGGCCGATEHRCGAGKAHQPDDGQTSPVTSSKRGVKAPSIVHDGSVGSIHAAHDGGVASNMMF
jgi:hypothetical protein